LVFYKDNVGEEEVVNGRVSREEKVIQRRGKKGNMQ
jgi:hypothetical protein